MTAFTRTSAPSPARPWTQQPLLLLLLALTCLLGCRDEQPSPTPTAAATAVARVAPGRTLPVSDDGLDLVLQGGGAKGLAHIGAIRELEAQQQPIRRVVGTSAGSIVAVLLVAGFSADEMQAAITERMPDGNIIMGSFLVPPDASEFSEAQLRQSITFRTLQDVIPDFIPEAKAEAFELGALTDLLKEPHFREIFSLVEAGGLYSGEPFVAWLRDQLNSNGRGLGDATLAEVYEATGIDMTIVATDADARILLMLNHRTAPDLPVVWAVRMSSSIPFVFQEVLWQSEWGAYRGEDISGRLVVDGGMITNLPLELVVSQEPEILAGMVLEPEPGRVLGLVLDHDSRIPGLEATPTPQAMLQGDALENARLEERWQQIGRRTVNLIDTLLNAHDHLVASTYPQHVCRLPAGGVETLEYDMSDAKIESLLAAAQETTRVCLANLAEQSRP